jgi:hypothetical protein
VPLHYQILIGFIAYAFGLVLICIFLRNAKEISHCNTDGDYLIDAEPERATAFTYQLQVKDGVGRIVPCRSNT